MRVGQARKRDGNEREIVDALRKVGIRVWRLNAEGLPDLLTFQAAGRWLPIEVKRQSAKARRLAMTALLTPAQLETHAVTKFPIVETVAQALALFFRDAPGDVRTKT
mgnify:FL=1